MALQIQSTPGKCWQCARRCAQARKHANMCGQAQCTLGLREKTKCFIECIVNAFSAHVFWIFPNRWSHTPSSFALLSYCRMQESVTRHMPLACVSFDASVSFEFISVTDACTHIQNMCCDTSPFACTKRGDANSVSLMATHDQQQNLANADQKYCTFTLKSVTLPIAVHGQFCKPYSVAHVKHGWTVAHLTMCVGRDCGNVFYTVVDHLDEPLF